MVMLVTLQQAKTQVRQDLDDEDTHITLLIHAASGMIINYMGSQVDFLDSNGAVILDSSGDPDVAPEIKLATLYLVGMLYRDRDGEFVGQWQQGYLPTVVTAILYPLRDPVTR